MKIIIVDDEISALKTFLPGVLDDLDTECKMFSSSPLSAVEYACKNKVDAAFLDVRMPEIDGVELAEKLIKVNPEIEIIFISAYAKDEKAIIERLNRPARFCHKPYSKHTLCAILADLKSKYNKPKLFLKTFGCFDLFVNGVAVDFSSRKAKELLALLTDANGSYVTMDTAIGNLWADKNAELSKRLYRDAVCRLRLALKDAGAENLVTFERARAVINTNAAECDMWNFLKGKGVYSGRYLPQYDWSVITESALEQLTENNRR